MQGLGHTVNQRDNFLYLSKAQESVTHTAAQITGLL